MAPEPLDDDETLSHDAQGETSVGCFALLACWLPCLAGHETSMLPYNDRMLLLISGAFPFIVLDSCGSHASTAPTIPWAAIPPHFPFRAAYCSRGTLCAKVLRQRKLNLCFLQGWRKFSIFFKQFVIIFGNYLSTFKEFICCGFFWKSFSTKWKLA